ncbi:MAG: hypothetical protein IPF79_02325 [Ignavibacteria bacterium]|nr:hypothetical protein [Ignavibacteria bacterium]
MQQQQVVMPMADFSTVRVMILRAGAPVAANVAKAARNGRSSGRQSAMRHSADRVQAEGAEHRPERGRCQPILMIGTALERMDRKEGKHDVVQNCERRRPGTSRNDVWPGSTLRNRYHDGWSIGFHRG